MTKYVELYGDTTGMSDEIPKKKKLKSPVVVFTSFLVAMKLDLTPEPVASTPSVAPNPYSSFYYK